MPPKPPVVARRPPPYFRPVSFRFPSIQPLRWLHLLLGLGAVLAVAVLRASPVRAAGAPPDALRFKRLTTAEGLSENATYCLLQDRTGFLWVGTQDGLNRYDGTGFRIFPPNPRNARALASGFILALAEERRTGHLWVGTGGGGLSRYDPATERFRTWRATGQPGGLASDFVRAVFVDRAGRVWVGTENGLCRYEPRTGAFVTYPHLLAPGERPDARHQSVRALTQGPDGTLWVGTGDGHLNRVDERRDLLLTAWQPPATPLTAGGPGPDVGQRAITTLLFDHAWRLWLGTEGAGLRAYEPATGRIRTYLPAPPNTTSPPHHLTTVLPSATIHCLLRDHAGTLWVGTAGGLSRFDDLTGTFRTIRHNPGFPNTSLPDDGVQSLWQDRCGLLWVATEGGLASFTDQPGAFAQLGPLLTGAWAVAAAAPVGSLWLGTEEAGLLRLMPGAAPEPVPLTAPGQHPLFIRALAPDRAGGVWVGTQSSGLRHYDPATGRVRTLRHDPTQPVSLVDDYVRGLLLDRSGTLWVGTEGGLSALDPRTGLGPAFRHDPADAASLPSDYVRQTLEDRRGRLWIATGGGGLALLDSARRGRFTTFRHGPQPTTLAADFVRVIHQDQRGTLWLGTEGGGLCRLDDARPPGRFTTFDQRRGLPSNVVYGILEDGAGFLWLSTNKGVARFDPRTGAVRRYDTRDGLPRDEFNAGAFLRTPADGRCYFGGPAGLTGFHPDSLRPNALVPPVVVTGLRLFNQPLALDSALSVRRALRLRPNENFLTFEFAALNFRLPDKNRYSYRLEGLPGDRWIDAGNRHEAPFTNLPPGEYTFRVRAANNDGLWNQQGAAVRVLIPPPWHGTWWFRFGLLLGGVGLLWLAYRARVQQLLALERVRHGIARDLHDDMGSTLSSISILSQVAGDHHRHGRTEQVAQLLGQIGESSHRMLDSMDDIVWAINPAHDSLEDVTTRMRRFASDVLETRDIDFSFTVAEAVLPLRLEMRARREFFLLFKEAVNNLAKYARCQQATIALTLEHRHLVLRVHDDGIGFDPRAPAQGGGNGMANMRTRAAALRAHLDLDTAPGQGTRFTLRVPV